MNEREREGGREGGREGERERERDEAQSGGKRSTPGTYSPSLRGLVGSTKATIKSPSSSPSPPSRLRLLELDDTAEGTHQ